ncbi:MAG: glycoside hydrolase family 13 protein [Clostridia bacterium]|nr:glycoside hydrolase family 13 protein [Clostridia bacterium]
MINREALFSDETELFKTPYEPLRGDKVTVRLRTLKGDVIKAYCIVNGEEALMKKAETDENFDYYTYSFRCASDPVSYYFVVFDDEDRVYVNKLGPVENSQPEYSFKVYPGFNVPDWAKGAVYYQIFTDRFCNGCEENDVEDNEYYYTGGHVRKIWDWYKTPDPVDVNCFYGGDLQGVREKLDYLQDLGVEVIYFNPLFVSPSNHKYDTQDYDYIDPHFAVIKEDVDHHMQDWEHHNGYAAKYIKRVTSKKNLEESNRYFAELVEEIHSRGMKVVMDGVFDHCGSFNKWMDKEGIYLKKKGYPDGAFQSLESPYRNYFKFKDSDRADSEYDGWWGYVTMPKIYYENSPEVVDAIMKIATKWLKSPYGCDGWRLDVAADIGYSTEYNHEFWKEFRKKVRRANKDAVIFAEHYGDVTPWFDGEEWDSIMNYDAFMEPVTWFLTGMEKHSEEYNEGRLNDGNLFFDSMLFNMSKFPRPALDSALNQLSNHDHSRFMTRTNRTVGTLEKSGAEAAGIGVDERVFKLGVMIQMTWPGAPGIYYGDEAGLVGWTDPDNRRTYPWGRENKELIEFHKNLILLRKRLSCLRKGSVKKLDAGNGYITYGRFDANDCCIVVINNTDNDIALNIPVWELGITWENQVTLLFDSASEKNIKPEKFELKYGRLLVELKARSGKIYGKKFKEE